MDNLYAENDAIKYIIVFLIMVTVLVMILWFRWMIDEVLVFKITSTSIALVVCIILSVSIIKYTWKSPKDKY